MVGYHHICHRRLRRHLSGYAFRKLLGCIICLVGVAMVAIPTGIISSSFINIIQKRKGNFKITT